jgi:hypothetical protein
MRKFIRVALFAAALAVLATTTLAAPRVETDPNKEYPCTPEAGAWMICVHEFRGPDAAELARQLALQIRQRDNLQAYVFNFSEVQREKMKTEWSHLGKLNPDGTPRELHVNIPEERVVLIGGYADMDAASAALKSVKKLPPPQLHLKGKTTFDTVTVMEPRGDGRVDVKQAEMNPFPTSFVAPNPTIQRQQQAKRADPFLKTLNENEDYSLLNNPKPWTLAVKEYVGDSMVVSRTDSTPFLEGLFKKKSADTLVATALQAHELARVLRELKFDAYVLHTRRSSIVAVGGFTAENNPEMQKAAERLLQLKLQTKDGKTPAIDLFAAPMEIPRP